MPLGILEGTPIHEACVPNLRLVCPNDRYGAGTYNARGEGFVDKCIVPTVYDLKQFAIGW